MSRHVPCRSYVENPRLKHKNSFINLRWNKILWQYVFILRMKNLPAWICWPLYMLKGAEIVAKTAWPSFDTTIFAFTKATAVIYRFFADIRLYSTILDKVGTVSASRLCQQAHLLIRFHGNRERLSACHRTCRNRQNKIPPQHHVHNKEDAPSRL